MRKTRNTQRRALKGSLAIPFVLTAALTPTDSQADRVPSQVIHRNPPRESVPPATATTPEDPASGERVNHINPPPPSVVVRNQPPPVVHKNPPPPVIHKNPPPPVVHKNPPPPVEPTRNPPPPAPVVPPQEPQPPKKPLPPKKPPTVG